MKGRLHHFFCHQCRFRSQYIFYFLFAYSISALNWAYSQVNRTADIKFNITSSREAPLKITAINLNIPDSTYVIEGYSGKDFSITNAFIDEIDKITGLEMETSSLKNKLILIGNPSSELEAFSSESILSAKLFDYLGCYLEDIHVQQVGVYSHLFKDLNYLSDGIYILKTGKHAARFIKNSQPGGGPTKLPDILHHFETLKSSKNDNKISSGARVGEEPNYRFKWAGNFGVKADSLDVYIAPDQDNIVDLDIFVYSPPYFQIIGNITNANDGFAELTIDGEFFGSREFDQGTFMFDSIMSEYEIGNTVVDKRAHLRLSGNFKEDITEFNLVDNNIGRNTTTITYEVLPNDTKYGSGKIVFKDLKTGTNLNNYDVLIDNAYRFTVDNDTLEFNLDINKSHTFTATENTQTSVDIRESNEIIDNLIEGDNGVFVFFINTEPWLAYLTVQYTNGSGVLLQSEGKQATSDSDGKAIIYGVTRLQNRLEQKKITATHSRDDLETKTTEYTVGWEHNLFNESLIEKYPSETTSNVFITINNGFDLIHNYIAYVNEVEIIVFDTLKIYNISVDSNLIVRFTENDETDVDITDFEILIGAKNINVGENHFSFKAATKPWFANLMINYSNGEGVFLHSEGQITTSDELGNASIYQVTTLPNRVATKQVTAVHSRDDLITKNSTYNLTLGDNLFNESLLENTPNTSNFSVRLFDQDGDHIENILVNYNGTTIPTDSVFTLNNINPGSLTLTFGPSDSTYQIFSEFSKTFEVNEGTISESITIPTTEKSFQAIYRLFLYDTANNILDLRNFNLNIDNNDYVSSVFPWGAGGGWGKDEIVFDLLPNPSKPWLPQENSIDIIIEHSDSSVQITEPRSYSFTLKDGENIDKQYLSTIPFDFYRTVTITVIDENDRRVINNNVGVDVGFFSNIIDDSGTTQGKVNIGPDPDSFWKLGTRTVRIYCNATDSSYQHQYVSKEITLTGDHSDTLFIYSQPLDFTANLIVSFNDGTNGVNSVELLCNGRSEHTGNDNTAIINDIIPIEAPDPLRFWVPDTINLTYDAIPLFHDTVRNEPIRITAGNNIFSKILTPMDPMPALLFLTAKLQDKFVDNINVHLIKMDEPEITFSGNTGNSSSIFFVYIPITGESSDYIVEYTFTDDSRSQFLKTVDTVNVKAGIFNNFESYLNKIPNFQDLTVWINHYINHTPGVGKSVEVYNYADSTLIGSAVTDNEGYVTIENVPGSRPVFVKVKGNGDYTSVYWPLTIPEVDRIDEMVDSVNYNYTEKQFFTVDGQPITAEQLNEYTSTEFQSEAYVQYYYFPPYPDNPQFRLDAINTLQELRRGYGLDSAIIADEPVGMTGEVYENYNPFTGNTFAGQVMIIVQDYGGTATNIGGKWIDGIPVYFYSITHKLGARKSWQQHEFENALKIPLTGEGSREIGYTQETTQFQYDKGKIIFAVKKNILDKDDDGNSFSKTLFKGFE